MGLFETGSVWGWLCVEIGLNLMGLFETRMNGEWASEDQWIIFDGLLSVASIEEWRWRQGETGFRRPMDYLRWAIVGGKYRRMAMESIENGLLCLAAFAEIIQSLFEQPHAEELEDAEVDAAH